MHFKIGQTISSLILCLILIGTATAQSDQESREEKRRKRTEARRLHKLIKTDFETGQFEPALARADSLLVVDSNNADAFYYQGRIKAAQGDTSAAESALELGTGAAPRSSRIKVYLGKLYFLGGRPSEAIELLDQVLAVKPNESPALYVKGQCLLQMGDTAAALEALDTALKLRLAKEQQ